jgi:hypothetical protein
MSHATTLQRITTEYSELEDRLRLSGETNDGKVVIWLTQRLAKRLLPLLLQWLERQHTVPRRSVSLFNFGQLSVQAVDTTPVPPMSWLATSIDISTSDKQVMLTFKKSNEQAARLSLTAVPLRQWLEILHEAYLHAGWPMDVWPTWMVGGASVLKGEQEVVWH